MSIENDIEKACQRLHTNIDRVVNNEAYFKDYSQSERLDFLSTLIEAGLVWLREREVKAGRAVGPRKHHN